jgi:hypothetical protein
MTWPQRVRFALAGGLAYEGDGLAVLAEAPAAPVEGVQSLSIGLSGHDHLTIHGARFSIPCPSDLNGDGTLNFFDIVRFLDLFGAQDPSADYDLDGQFNFFDVAAYIGDFQAGCP